MIVLPSDHLIKKEKQFIEIIKSCEKFLDDNGETIVTLGMKPSRAETGYGYIKCGNNNIKLEGYNIINVEAFVEKPNLKKAKEYLKDSSFLWNGGMFLWKTEYILSQIKKYLPNTYEAIDEIIDVKESQLQNYIDKNYNKTDAISVDYGILEKSESIFVVPSEIGWDDVGSFEAIERYRSKDIDGNIHVGHINSVKSGDNLIIAPNQKIIIDGLSGIYVIENDGKIIIGKKDNLSNIKDLKSIL